MTYLAIALALSVLAIAAQMVGDAIRQSNRRHSEQIAEQDRDWRASVPRGFQVPDGREQVGFTRGGVVPESVVPESKTIEAQAGLVVFPTPPESGQGRAA